jgi:RHS repeat-associated protein
LANEQTIYSNLSTTRVAKPADYPTDTYTATNAFVAKTNGSGNKIGPSMVIKVMAGDKFNVRVSSWYTTSGNPISTIPAGPLSDLVTILNGGLGNVVGSKATAAELTTTDVLRSQADAFLSNRTYSTSRPKAFLSWILFNEQFEYVITGSNSIQVGNDGDLTVLMQNGVPVTKNGYLYLYFSNETPNIDVLFDNLQVTHNRGPILEENHFYPFGVKLEGISSKAANNLVNKYQYNSKEKQEREFSDLSGLETYDFGARQYDAQIGRWEVIDPKTELYSSSSPYNYCLNNPIKYIDPNGEDVYLTIWYSAEGEIGHAGIAVDNYKTVEKKDKNGNVIYDKNGKAKTEQVKDGTVTYYDFWPGGEGGAGKKNFDENQVGVIQKKSGLTLNDILTKDIGNGEKRAAEGVVQITADAKRTGEVKDYANKLYLDQVKDEVQYNGSTNNCSNFAVNCMSQLMSFKPSFGVENINTDGNFFLRIPSVNINSVTPNFLFRDAAKMVTNQALGKVLKSDSKKAGNDFVNAVTNDHATDKTPGH